MDIFLIEGALVVPRLVVKEYYVEISNFVSLAGNKKHRIHFQVTPKRNRNTYFFVRSCGQALNEPVGTRKTHLQSVLFHHRVGMHEIDSVCADSSESKQ